jgi:hypothetical protein
MKAVLAPDWHLWHIDSAHSDGKHKHSADSPSNSRPQSRGTIIYVLYISVNKYMMDGLIQ